MNRLMLPSGILMLAVATACPMALADEPNNAQADPQADTQQPVQAKRSDQKSMDKRKAMASDAQPKLDSSQVMKISQQAMTHIAAAEQALDKGKTTAAKSALKKSEQALSRLYDTPALATMLNEFDEAINSLSGKRPAMEPVDLAPLAARVSTFQAYVDPDVAAGVKDAQQKAKQGDTKAAQDALRLARNRAAIDVAFLPVEEAYIRVLAAQQALQNGKQDDAKRLLSNVPIVIGQVQVATPLVPVRFKLQAAAEAAEAKQWDRSKQLLGEASQDMQQLEILAKGTDLKSEIAPIADQAQKLTQQAKAGEQVDAKQIRELAKRTREIADTSGMEKQG